MQIVAGKKVTIDSALEANDQILVDGGADVTGVSVMIPTVGGITSREAANGLIDIRGVNDVIMMGHLETRGAGLRPMFALPRRTSKHWRQNNDP